MKRLALLLCASSAALGFAAACGGDDDERGNTQDAGLDSTSTLPPMDAAVVDAADAAPMGREDAAPRTCSDANFCRVPLAAPEVLRAIWGDGTGVLWTVSDTGDILRYDGTKNSTFTVFASHPTDSYYAVWGTSPTDIWVGGTSGLLHGTGASSSTLTFAPVTIPGDTTAPINAIWGASATDIWAVGGDPDTSSSRVVHLTGGTWKEASPADADGVVWSTVFGTPTSGVWIGGTTSGFRTSAAAYRKAPKDTTFTEVTPDLPDDLLIGNEVNPSRIDVGLALGDLNVHLLGMTAIFGIGAQSRNSDWNGTSPDGGVFTWTLFGPPPPSPNVKQTGIMLTSSWVGSATNAWVTGVYGRLQHFDGTTWTQADITLNAVPETTDLYGVWGNSTTGELWVVGNQVVIHKAP